jgi:hypothetical protein
MARMLPELDPKDLPSEDQTLNPIFASRVRRELLLTSDTFGFRAFGLAINDQIRQYENMLETETDPARIVEFTFKRAALVSIVNAYYGSIEELPTEAPNPPQEA